MTKETQSSQADDGTDWKLSCQTIHLFIVDEVGPSDAAYQTQTLRTSNRSWSFLVIDFSAPYKRTGSTYVRNKRTLVERASLDFHILVQREPKYFRQGPVSSKFLELNSQIHERDPRYKRKTLNTLHCFPIYTKIHWAHIEVTQALNFRLLPVHMQAKFGCFFLKDNEG